MIEWEISENTGINKRKLNYITNTVKETQTHVKSKLLKLLVFYINADSLLNKIDELKFSISNGIITLFLLNKFNEWPLNYYLVWIILATKKYNK